MDRLKEDAVSEAFRNLTPEDICLVMSGNDVGKSPLLQHARQIWQREQESTAEYDKEFTAALGKFSGARWR